MTSFRWSRVPSLRLAGALCLKNAKLLISERRESRGLAKPCALAQQVSCPANPEQGMTCLPANDVKKRRIGTTLWTGPQQPPKTTHKWFYLFRLTRSVCSPRTAIANPLYTHSLYICGVRYPVHPLTSHFRGTPPLRGEGNLKITLCLHPHSTPVVGGKK